ncbi:MAG: phenylalanine--tRNA ligase subunit beta, partial [Chthoniobacteraceae bacterium]
MKVSLNWLRDYVDFPGDAQALSELLTMAGVEVEGIETSGVAIDKVVVAQILSSEQHPNADRLSVCQVDDGSGTPRQIVCGAKNYKGGDKVPLAQPGAVLPGDFKIKVGKLRGIESQGMLCSPDELSLPKGEDGLLILLPDSEVGAPLSKLYPSDTVLDLEITPNRPDLLSHVGIAREIAALTGTELKPRRESKSATEFAGTVEVEADECPFYTARRISHVQVGASPAWLREKLEAVGVRSINNIVDITNFVMLEVGQPLHAFDMHKLQGPLCVRMAKAGEKLLALDGRTYELTPQNLVIADSSGPVALAGVMGGEATGVTAETTEIVLESAYFLGSNIRRTSRSLGLMSDSSYRFERDVDPAGVLVASQHAAELIAHHAGGEAGELRAGFAANAQFGFDPNAAAEGHVYSAPVPLRKERVATLLGIEVDEDEIEAILTRFGLRQAEGGWEVPSFRPDLTREVDLIEEIARVIGIDAVPSLHIGAFVESSESDHAHDRLTALRQRLAGQGLHEARSLTLISERALGQAFSGPEVLRVRNPLNEDQVVLRPSLVPGLLDAVARNARAGERSIRLFECGRVFSQAQPEERTHLAILLSGPTSDATWRGGAERIADLLEVKGVLARVLGSEPEFQRTDDTRFGVSANILVDGKVIGQAAQLWPAAARELDCHAPVVFAEVDLSGILAAPAASKRYQEVPRFPAITRDIALLAPSELPHGRIAAALLGANEPLLADVSLFDVFTDPTGEKVPVDKKSLAYSLTYRVSDRTLTADEVNAVHARLKQRLQSETGV